jgi:anti-sigma factor RsiW
MNRDRARELMVDYCNGHLSPEENSQIEALLEADGSLRAERDTIRRELQIIRGNINDPVIDSRLTSITEQVMHTIRSERHTAPLLSPAMRSYLRAAASVTFILICFAIFFLLRPDVFQEPPAVDPPPAVTVRKDPEPARIRLLLGTSRPDVHIYWTFSRDFEPVTSEE